MADESYANIRDIDQLGRIIGAKCVDITQHDKEDWEERRECFVAFHFDNGYTVKFPIGDEGFDVENCEPETEC